MLSRSIVFIALTCFFSGALAISCWRQTTCSGPLEAAFTGDWDSNVLSPSSRTVSPVQILSSNKVFQSQFSGPATLKGNGSMLIFDFGQEVGGILSVQYQATGVGALGMAFTEAKNFTGPVSDESNGGSGPDGALYANITATLNETYTIPDAKLRGGFRYLTMFAITNGTIDLNITDVLLEISFQPTWSNLKAYGGYFHSNDHLLNRVWYAGAYTVQANAIPPNTGREWPPPTQGWLNDANVTSTADSVFVDGAKRDRAIWAGDFGMSVPTILISTGDAEGVKNSLQVLYDYQVGFITPILTIVAHMYIPQNASTGELPEVTPPIGFYGSDTYHMATMMVTYYYVLHTNDMSFLTSIWANYKSAMAFITAKVDGPGLLNVTGISDWGRSAIQGGYNSEANMLLYRVLTTGSILATWVDEAELARNYSASAQTLKTAINNDFNNLWDPQVG